MRREIDIDVEVSRTVKAEANVYGVYIVNDAEPCPEPEIRLYSAQVPVTGGFTSDTLVAGSYGSGSFSSTQWADLAIFLQTNVTADCGATLEQGDATFLFFVALAVPPFNWTWNGNLIFFNDLGVASIGCYDTGLFAFGGDPDPVNWTSLRIPTNIGAAEIQGTTPNYGDPGFQAAWQAFATPSFGANAIAEFEITPTQVRLQVKNTYLTMQSVVSIGSPGLQTDNFSPAACP